MTNLVWLIWLATCATVAFSVYGFLTYYQNRRMVRDRFKKGGTRSLPLLQPELRESSLKKQFLEWISSCGTWGLSNKEEAGRIRLVMIQAGFRHPKGPAIYFGMRALMAVFLPLPYLLANVMNGVMSSGNLGICFMLAAGGFYLPQYFLGVLTRRRQDRLDKALPDVLDLIIVCMEAGLSLHATLNRVTDEVRSISKDMYQEMQLTNAELRTGIPREDALKNMGERTGVQNIKALMTLMIQSEKMGASIVQALRTHASFLRVQRSQRAEEKAAKLPVKILFPMIAFIFPSIFIVILGPAVIQIMKNPVFGNMMSGSGG